MNSRTKNRRDRRVWLASGLLLVSIGLIPSQGQGAPKNSVHTPASLAKGLIRSLVARSMRRPVYVNSHAVWLTAPRPPKRTRTALAYGLLAAAVGGVAIARGPVEQMNWAKVLLRTGIADVVTLAADLLHVNIPAATPQTKARRWLRQRQLNFASTVLVDVNGRRAAGGVLVGSW